MPEIVFILPSRNIDTLHRTLSMLTIQKDKGFRVCVADLTGSLAASVLSGFEHSLTVSAVPMEASGEPFWKRCLEVVPDAEWVCFLGTDVDLNVQSVGRMRKCIADHPAYDVFHWNLAEPYRKYRLRTRPGRLFTSVFTEGGEAPLSSFVFRARTLREVFEADPEAAGMDLAVILSAAGKPGIRSVRRERIGYRKPDVSADPALVEKDVRARLAFFRWSERFFGEDYPLDVSARLALFAGELARLYPSFSPDELKEDLNTFAVVSGPIRRLKASSALKTALKARQGALTARPAEK